MQRREFVAVAAGALGVAPRDVPAGWLPQLALDRTPSRTASAGAVDPRDLQPILDEAARALGVVGAQLALFDGQQVHEVATGFANRERKLAVTTDTLFQIGSTTKLFNAALVFSLIDEGLLHLDEPIVRWMPDFTLADPAAARQITLKHLLSMSSGLDNGPYRDHGRGDDALERYVRSLADIPQVFAPGTGYGYANAGSNVAGLVASRVGKASWESLLTARVLRPLALEQSAMFAEDLLFHPVSLGYRLGAGGDPTRVRVWGLPRSMAPAGGTLCTSAGDLVRFARMLIEQGAAPNGGRVLSAESARSMQTPVVTLPTRIIAQRWCPGPYWKEWDGLEIFGHSGTNSGGSSMLLWCPARRVAIATIANVPNQGYPLADRVFDTVFPRIFRIAKPATPTPATVRRVEVERQRYVGEYGSFGSTVRIADEGGTLIARVYNGPPGTRGDPDITSELIPLGGDRFLPADRAMGGNRGWDVAFWGGERGRATHFLNGVFAFRRAA